jgi:hypothetical protein
MVGRAATIRTPSNIFPSSGGHLVASGSLAGAGNFAVTDTIETPGGAKPRTSEAFVRKEQNALTAA